MTELWLAKSPTAANVAIKRVRVEHARDQRFVQAFLDEVRVATTLRHANIAAILDAGLENGEYFVAMEWVHGVDLRHILANACATARQLPVEHALTIALATAAALQHAHAHGTVHSDVAPANIVVGFDGNVKVIDFGLAKAAHRTRETQPGVKGKVAYMSPEQCAGQRVDARSDLYSLGVVIYELVTARRVFKAPNDFLTMTAILHGEIPVPSTIRAGIAPELDAILMTALARDPDQRFQSAGDLRAALEQFCIAKYIRTSPALLADHLREVFGNPAEPWIVEPARGDFDGTRPGIVPIPEAAMQGALGTPGPMLAVATPPNGDEATDIVAPLDLPEADLSVGDSTMLVRSSPKHVRRVRRGLIAVVAFTALAVVALVVVLRETDDDDPRQRANPNIKLPPPSNPIPVVSPTLAADAAASEPPVTVPEPVVAPAPVIKQDTVHKKKKKKVKRPARRPRKAPAEQPTESAWDRESLFPK